MSKFLVIVESPAKTKTIKSFLGKDYKVMSSIGHIRDLAPLPTSKTKKSKKTEDKYHNLTVKMGINPKKNWSANYATLSGKEKILSALKTAAQKAEIVYLATDLDREGEAIAWHLKEAIGDSGKKFLRVTFTEITKKPILEAFKKPTSLNISRVNAQQTRRFLDRIVGFMLSPLLWKKIARGLSAGRVQSVALRAISEREYEISQFNPEEYWEIHSQLKDNKESTPFKAQVTKYNSKAFRPTNKKDAEHALDQIKKGQFLLETKEVKKTKIKSPAPLITSTMQQAASIRLRFNVKRTMSLAQQLYEAGFITYMRTDSTNLSQTAIDECREFIKRNYTSEYLPKNPKTYHSKKSAQEAHEAIRPTDLKSTLSDVSAKLNEDCTKLYNLIRYHFIACQMQDAIYEYTTFTIKNSNYTLKAKGKVLIFDGFQKAAPAAKESKDQILPQLNKNSILISENTQASQHFTSPSPRYSEASLVKELEKKSIGRPSTYASVISTIQERGYVELKKRRFYCLKMGEIVTNRLLENFQELMDYGFTASMEEELDKIAEGKSSWTKTLDKFYKDFTAQLECAEIKMKSNDPVDVDLKCNKCSRNMTIRSARTGVFLGCSGYLLPVKERCKETINLTSSEEFEEDTENTANSETETLELKSKKRCPTCNAAMDPYIINTEKKIHICGIFPDCKKYIIEEGKFRLKGYTGPIIACDKCGKDMQLQTGRFGKYFKCSAAPECTNTRKLLKNGEAAPPAADPIHMTELKCEKSDGYFILRDSAAGIFLASSKFPKSRETRRPLVKDLIRHKSELDKKFLYLTKAPIKDPDNNETTIHFSRKSKSHYISSVKDGKPSKWILIWNGSDWKEKTP